MGDHVSADRTGRSGRVGVGDHGRNLARRAATLAALTLLGSGCQPGPLVVRIPFEGTARAAIVALEDESLVELYAVEAATATSTPLLRQFDHYTRDHALTITVIHYDRTLEAMDLVPGPITPISARTGSTASIPSRPLPAPYLEITRATVSGGVVSSFAPTMALDSTLQKIRIPGDACTTFTIASSTTLMGNNTAIAGATSLADGSALLLQQNPAQLMTSTLYGSTPLAVSFGAATPLALASARDGRVWIATDQSLLLGTPASGFPPHPAPPPGQVIALAAGTPGEDPSTMYAATRPGSTTAIEVQVFSRGTWTRVQSLTSNAAPPFGRYLLVAQGASDVFLAWPTGQLYHFAPDVVASEQPAAGENVTALGLVPLLGVLAGTSAGRIYRRSPGAPVWTELVQDAPPLVEILNIVPWHNGFNASGVPAISLVWAHGHGFCAPQTIATSPFQLTVEATAVVHGGMLAACQAITGLFVDGLAEGE